MVEGGVVTYTAKVSAPVTGSDLVISLANGQKITIPVGSSTGTVDYVAPNNVHTTNPALTNSITGTTGGNYEKLDSAGNTTVTVTDGPGTKDNTGLSLTATDTVAEGGKITYVAKLTNPAGTEMKVTLSNGEVITIAKGQTEGKITIDAPSDDVYIDAGKLSVTVTSTTGGDFEQLTVSNVPAVTNVTDTIDTSTVTLTASTNSVVEGGVVTLHRQSQRAGYRFRPGDQPGQRPEDHHPCRFQHRHRGLRCAKQRTHHQPCPDQQHHWYYRRQLREAGNHRQHHRQRHRRRVPRTTLACR
nr:hypothetical protein [Pseudomonas sp. BIGb0427]